MSAQNFTEATPVAELPPGQPRDGLIVMPERIDAEGLGYYGEQASATYKDLVMMNSDASYYTDKRTSVHRFSAGEPEVIAFLIGFFISDVPKSIAYDLLKAYVLSKFKKKPNSVVNGEVLIASKANGYSTWQKYKVTGNMDDAIRMIDKMQEIQNNEHSSSKKET
jgi:hypothetical protein